MPDLVRGLLVGFLIGLIVGFFIGWLYEPDKEEECPPNKND